VIDYLQQGKTVTDVYYAGLICKQYETVKGKRRGKLIQGELLHNDSAQAHNFHVAMSLDCSYELLFQPSYFADVALLDFECPDI